MAPDTVPNRPPLPDMDYVAACTNGVDQRKAVCSICRHGIFTGQPSQWSRKPLGLIHANPKDCAKEAARA